MKSLIILNKPFKAIKVKGLIILMGLLLSSISYADDLKPFVSDGCSSFPDGTLKQKELWLSCCTAHDVSYWQGGTRLQRQQADAALQSCVADAGEPAIALIMLAGVKVGGSPYWPTRFRWGYGWSYPRFYGELSQEELEEIAAALETN